MLNDQLKGMLQGVIICLIIVIMATVFWQMTENAEHENILVIRYSSNKEYDRKMVRDMVNNSQISTNFVITEIKMDKYWIEYRMSNPKEH